MRTLRPGGLTLGAIALVSCGGPINVGANVPCGGPVVRTWCGEGACAPRCLGDRWERQDFSVGNDYLEIVAGYVVDFDGDGHRDAVWVSQRSCSAVARFGDGSGRVGAEVRWPIGRTAGDLAFGDFDGDGHLDVAVAGRSPDLSMHPCNGEDQNDMVRVYRGTGRSVTPMATEYPNTSNPRRIYATHLSDEAGQPRRADLLLEFRNEPCFALLPAGRDGAFTIPAAGRVTTCLDGAQLLLATLPFVIDPPSVAGGAWSILQADT
jgi:hypothetical protein